MPDNPNLQVNQEPDGGRRRAGVEALATFGEATFQALGEPLEPQASLWRFMDFTKYVSMLHRRALFFTRADELPDPFEGLHARRVRRSRHSVGRTSERVSRGSVLLSCWHQNDHESAAMWRLYLSASEGVAIRTSAARLRKALASAEVQLYLGKVRYIERPGPVHRSELDVFFSKRSSFDYEREARVLWHADAAPEGTGSYLSADLETLIEAVVVSPMAEPWFTELVKSVSEKYDFTLPVTISSMREPLDDEEP